MSGVYEANPGGLRRAIAGMERLPEMARELGSNFQNEERIYTDWPGWTDDFAKDVRPTYERNNEYCVGIATSLFNALNGLVTATLANLDNIEGTQSYTQEQIREHSERTREVTEDGGRR